MKTMKITKISKRIWAMLLVIAMVVTSINYTPKTVSADDYSGLQFTKITCVNGKDIYYHILQNGHNAGPWYGDGGITFQMVYSADYKASDTTVTVDGNEPGDILAYLGDGLCKINPTRFPDEEYTVVELKTGDTVTSIVFKNSAVEEETTQFEEGKELVPAEKQNATINAPARTTGNNEYADAEHKVDTFSYVQNKYYVATGRISSEKYRKIQLRMQMGADPYTNAADFKTFDIEQGATIEYKYVFQSAIGSVGIYDICYGYIDNTDVEAGEITVEGMSLKQYSQLPDGEAVGFTVTEVAAGDGLSKIKDFVLYNYRYADVDGYKPVFEDPNEIVLAEGESYEYKILVEFGANVEVATISQSGEVISGAVIDALTNGGAGLVEGNRYQAFVQAVYKKADGTEEKSPLANTYFVYRKNAYTQYNDIKQIHIITANNDVDLLTDASKKKTNSTIIVKDADGTQLHVDYGTANVRGNSTAAALKKAWNIKFESKYDLFGMGKAKKWSLLANAFDKSMLRNKLALGLGIEFGIPYTGESEYIDVYINGTYNGTYVATESVETGSTRVDIDEESTTNNDILLEIDANGRDLVSDAHLWDPTKEHPNVGAGEVKEENGQYSGTNAWSDLTPTYQIRFAVNDPGADPSEKEEYIQYTTDYAEKMGRAYQIVSNVEQAIKSNKFSEIEKLIDVDSFVNFYLVEEIFKNQDIAFSSTRFFIKGDKLYAGPLWDFDLSSGNVDPNYYLDTSHLPTGYKAQTMPWFGDLMKNKDFSNLVKRRFKEKLPVIKKMYTGEGNLIDEYTTTCAGSFARNYAPKAADNSGAGWNFSTDGSYGYSTYYTFANHEETVSHLRTWLEDRIAFLEEEWEISDVDLVITDGDLIVSWYPKDGATGYRIAYTPATQEASPAPASFYGVPIALLETFIPAPEQTVIDVAGDVSSYNFTENGIEVEPDSNITVSYTTDNVEYTELGTVLYEGGYEAITDWVQLTGTSSKNQATVYAQQSVVDLLGNEGLRGFYDAGATNAWGVPEGGAEVRNHATFAIALAGGNATALYINGTQYDIADATSEYVYAGADCVYINQDLVDAKYNEINYYKIELPGTTFGEMIIKVVGSQADMEIPELDDSGWVKFESNAANSSNMAVNGDEFYVMSSFYDAIGNKANFGLYDKASSVEQPGWGNLFAGEYAEVPIVSYINGGAVKGVIIDGQYYPGDGKLVAQGGDIAYLAQSLFELEEGEDSHIFAVTLQCNDAVNNRSFVVKVVRRETDDSWVLAGSSNGYSYYYNQKHSATEVVNVQQPGEAKELGVYMHVPSGISTVSINGTEADENAVHLMGAGVLVYLSALNEGENTIIIKHANGKAKVLLKKEEGAAVDPDIPGPGEVTVFTYKPHWEARRNCNLSWPAVEGAIGYAVYADGVLVETLDAETRTADVDAYDLAKYTSANLPEDSTVKDQKSTAGPHTVAVVALLEGDEASENYEDVNAENIVGSQDFTLYTNYVYGNTVNLWNVTGIDSAWNFTICESIKADEILRGAIMGVHYYEDGSASLDYIDRGLHAKEGDQAWTIKAAIYDEPSIENELQNLSFDIIGPAQLIGQQIQIKCVPEECDENDNYIGVWDLDEAGNPIKDKEHSHYEEERYTFEDNGNGQAVLHYSLSFVAENDTYDLLFGLGLLDFEGVLDVDRQLTFTDPEIIKAYGITGVTGNAIYDTQDADSNDIFVTWTTDVPQHLSTSYKYNVTIKDSEGNVVETYENQNSGTQFGSDKGFAAGTYTVTVESLFNGAITSSMSTTVTIEETAVEKPELIISNISVPMGIEYRLGDTIPLTVEVKNIGNVVAHSDEDQIFVTYHNKNANQAVASMITYTNTPTIEAGATYVGTVNYVVTEADVAAGMITFSAFADDHKVIDEINEDNNTSYINVQVYPPLTQTVLNNTDDVVTATWPEYDGEKQAYVFEYMYNGVLKTVESTTNSVVVPDSIDYNTDVYVYAKTAKGDTIKISRGHALPDLVIDSITTSKDSYVAGELVQITVSMKNNGVATAIPNDGNIVIRMGSDNNPALDLYKTMAEDPRGQKLVVGDTFEWTFDYVLTNSDIEKGTINMWATADADIKVTEADETNNVSESVEVVIRETEKPDFIISDISIPYDCYAVGDVIQVTATMKNVGAVASTGKHVLKIWRNGENYANNWGFDDPSTLEKDGEMTKTIPYTVTEQDLAEGSIRISAYAEADYIIAESDETNNESESIMIKIGVKGELNLENKDNNSDGTPDGTVTATWNTNDMVTGYKLVYISNGVEESVIIKTTGDDANVDTSVDGKLTYTFTKPIDNQTDVKIKAAYDVEITDETQYYDYAADKAEVDLIITGVQIIASDDVVQNNNFVVKMHEAFDIKTVVTNIGTAQVKAYHSDDWQADYANAVFTTGRDDQGEVMNFMIGENNYAQAIEQYNDGLEVGEEAAILVGKNQLRSLGDKIISVTVDDAGWIVQETGKPASYVIESNEDNNKMEIPIKVILEQQKMDWKPFDTSESVVDGEDVFTGDQKQPVGNVSGLEDGTYVISIANGSDWRPMEFKIIDTSVNDMNYEDIVTSWRGYGGQYTKMEFTGTHTLIRGDSNAEDDINDGTKMYFAQVSLNDIENYSYDNDTIEYTERYNGDGVLQTYEGNGFQYHTRSFAAGKYYLAKFVNDDGSYIVIAFRIPGDLGQWVKANASDISDPDAIPMKFHDLAHEAYGTIYYDATDLGLATITTYNGNHVALTTDGTCKLDPNANNWYMTLEYGHINEDGLFEVGIADAEREELGYDPGEVILLPEAEVYGLQGNNTILIKFPELMQQLPIHSPLKGEKDSEYYLLKVYYDTVEHPDEYVHIPLRMVVNIPTIEEVHNLSVGTRGTSALTVTFTESALQQADGYVYDIYVNDKMVSTVDSEGTYEFDGDVIEGLDLETMDTEYTVKVVARWCQQEIDSTKDYKVGEDFVPHTKPGNPTDYENIHDWVLIDGENILPIKNATTNSTIKAQIYYYTDDDMYSVIGYNGHYISLNGNTKYFTGEDSMIYTLDGPNDTTFESKFIHDNYYDGQILINAANLFATYEDITEAESTLYYTVKVAGENGNVGKDFYFKVVLKDESATSTMEDTGEWVLINGQYSLPVMFGSEELQGTVYFYDYPSVTKTYGVTGYNDYYMALFGDSEYYAGKNATVEISEALEAETSVVPSKGVVNTELDTTEKVIYDKLYAGEIQVVASQVFDVKYATNYYIMKITDGAENVTYVPFKVVVQTGDVDVIGFQINTNTAEGGIAYYNPSFRVVSKTSKVMTIGNKLYKVKGHGTVYAFTEDLDGQYQDMVVDSSNEKVYYYESTGQGVYGNWKDNGNEKYNHYYALSFEYKFYSTVTLTKEYAFRAYAVLDVDGEDQIVYGSSVYASTMERIAESLYKNKQMSSLAAHNYLYENILNIVALKNNRANIGKELMAATGVTSKDDEYYDIINKVYKDIYNYVYCLEGYTYLTRGAFKSTLSEAEQEKLTAKLNEYSGTNEESVEDWMFSQIDVGFYDKVAYTYDNSIDKDFDAE